jgi:hypothetical protein
MKPLLLALLLIAGDQRSHDRDLSDFKVEQKDNIQKSVAFSRPGGERTVRVDNVFGAVHVTAYDGATVEISAVRLARAESQERLAKGLEEVQLKLTERDNTIEAYVDGPFRCHCEGSSGIHDRGRRYYGYEVRYDFDIRVPRTAKVWIRNVNSGEVTVDGVAGGYDVENINGGVTMRDVAGSGRAYALNGGMHVTFRENPRENSYFGSLNGQVEAAFKPGLSADLRFKTFNGNVYTDFPVTYLPQEPGTGERRGTKYIYKSNAFTAVRVGSGGPEIKFDAFNGNIRILQREN